MNKKEEIAEYIIKNLIFLFLFGLFSFYGISNILLRGIQNYQEQKDNLKFTQNVLTKTMQNNQEIQQEIQNTITTNSKNLDLLEKGINEAEIEAVAKEFFEIKSIKKKQEVIKGDFTQTSFEIQGKSNGTKAFFDFINKIKTLFSNIAFSLPLEIGKEDPLSNTLDVTLVLKSTKLNQKKSNN